MGTEYKDKGEWIEIRQMRLYVLKKLEEEQGGVNETQEGVTGCMAGDGFFLTKRPLMILVLRIVFILFSPPKICPFPGRFLTFF